jgi:hypothetical protein
MHTHMYIYEYKHTHMTIFIHICTYTVKHCIYTNSILPLLGTRNVVFYVYQLTVSGNDPFPLVKRRTGMVSHPKNFMLFILSVNMYLLGFCIQGSVLHIGFMAMSKTDKNHNPQGAYLVRGGNIQ